MPFAFPDDPDELPAKVVTEAVDKSILRIAWFDHSATKAKL